MIAIKEKITIKCNPEGINEKERMKDERSE